MRHLITADLHLSPDPAHAYRFDAWARLVEAAKKAQPDKVVIAGDLVHRKSGHDGAFVNAVVDRLAWLREHTDGVLWLQGNHDYQPGQVPFWRFVGKVPGVRYIESVEHADGVLYVPHFPPDVTIGWPSNTTRRPCSYVVTHYPLHGRSVYGGRPVEGEPRLREQLESLASNPDRPKGILSGDLHEPFTDEAARRVPWYSIGSPHPVAIGENHDPRFMLFECDDTAVEHPPGEVPLPHVIKRVSVEAAGPSDLAKVPTAKGDHVRIDWSSPPTRADAAAAAEWAKTRGVVLLGNRYAPPPVRVEDLAGRSEAPADTWRAWAAAHNLTEDQLADGLKFLADALAAGGAR